MIRFKIETVKEPEDQVKLWLEPTTNNSASVSLRAETIGDEYTVRSTLLVFNPDGTINAIGGISESFGFELDHDGRLIIR